MIWLAALIIGIVDAIVLYVFEFIGIDGTVWLWNDVLDTDVYRWRVIPVAIVLGLILTATFKLLRVKRIDKEGSGELIDELNDSPSTLSGIGAVLVIGLVSLLAGASLGPEASLMLFSAGVGSYMATRMKLGSMRQLLILASVGALLVAFIDSFIMVLIPVLLLLQQWRKAKQKPNLKAILVVLAAGVASFATIRVIHYFFDKDAHGLIPTLPAVIPQDYLVAVIVGLVAGFLAMSLNYLVRLFSRVSVMYSQLKFPGRDWLFALAAGLGLGFLYYSGGPLVQFSGKVGTELLAQHGAQLGVSVLLSMVVIKIVATAWSNGTGYRGGLVFPSIFVGLALGLLVAALFPQFGYAGAIVGSIAGMLTAAVGSAALGAVFLVAALPYQAWPLAACAIVGTLIFSFIHKKLTPNKKSAS